LLARLAPVTFEEMADYRSALLKSELNTRRSQRVAARIRVEVQRRAEDKGPLSEIGHTLVVNAHGALVSLAMKVQANDLLMVKNVTSGEEMYSRVIRVGEVAANHSEVALEFTEPAPRFWHIDFPPADWKVA
jgi:translation initiation factor 6 (eIF-6)